MSLNGIENEPSSPENINTPEHLRYKLDLIMSDIAAKVNKQFGEPVLNDDGSINMVEWEVGKNGPYTRELRKLDRDTVNQYKVKYSGSSSMKPGPERDAKVSLWEKNRGMDKPALLELLTTAVMDKIMGEEFYVIRSSAFDDYVNSVDNLMINKKTGAVVCAFDEVRRSEAADKARKERQEEVGEKSRTEQKEERVKRKAREGGTRIKYGFGLSAGKLVKKQIRGVPMFYLSVEEKELDTLLEKMDYRSETPNQTELEFFDKLIGSLADQVKMLKTEKKIDPEVAENLQKFENSLGEIGELRKKF